MKTELRFRVDDNVYRQFQYLRKFKNKSYNATLGDMLREIFREKR